VLAKGNLRVLLLEGRTSPLIGLRFLALCLTGADLLSNFANNTFLKIVKGSLLIGGWVASAELSSSTAMCRPGNYYPAASVFVAACG